MTSRERVRKAIHFEKPDRVPIDLGATSATCINAEVYDRLKRRLGMDTPTKVHTARNMLAQVDMEFIERFRIDTVAVDATVAGWSGQDARRGVARRLYGQRDLYYSPTANIKPDPAGGWLLCNKAGEPFARMPSDGFYFDYLQPPMSGVRIDPAKHRPCPTVPDADLEAFAARAKFLYETTDKALVGWGSGLSLVGLSAMLTDNITQGSLDEWLCMLMTEKNAAHDMMNRSAEAALARTKLYYQAAGEYMDVWGVASDDAGTQRGGLMAPELFREMIAPHYRKLCDWIHANTHWKTFLHSCGAIFDYIRDWHSAGIDIFNPVQISAANMDPRRLMREFGGKVIFWGGGCDTQSMLPKGTPEQIRLHVLENMRIFGEGAGGFVFSQVHNIQPNVPVDNIIALLDAANEFAA